MKQQNGSGVRNAFSVGAWIRGGGVGSVLTVVVVVGVLVGIVLVNVLVFGQSQRDKERIADVRTIQQGLEVYHGRNHAYPTSLSLLAPKYISFLPTDPSGSVYLYNAYATSTRACQAMKASGYHLGSPLEGRGVFLGNSDASALPPGAGVLCAGGSSPTGFDGAANKCVVGAASSAQGSDNCYDVTN